VLALTRSGARVRFAVRVVPRAGTNAVGGLRDGALVVRVSAPPAEGRANESVVRVLARAIGVAQSDVRIESGAASRTKTVSVPAAAEARVLLLCN